MRRPFLLLAGAALVSCAAPAASPPAPPAAPAMVADERQAIVTVLDDWHDAARRADLERYFGHLAEDAVFLGTDATERWTKAAFLAYAKPHFDRGKAWAFRATRREIVVDASGAIAWFDEDLETEGLGPARGSGVLARRGGAWKILQYNLTITVPNDRFALVKEAAGPATVLEAKESDPAARVGWLSGAWVGVSDGGERVEETWMVPVGGKMVGSGRSSKDDKLVFFELLRIEARDGKLVYVAHPLGKPPTEFVEVAGTTAERITFENRAHDWPKRVIYQRTAEGVAVTVEGDPAQPRDAWTMKPAVVSRRAFPAPAR
ncbi:MAG: nuclear transport factor 2 family protein [Myxococcales bacterium]|nr:nuclear transport factor 2 family protein [Myxococcales bacterium]